MAHPENDHQPHFLRQRSFLFFSWFIILIELVFLVQVLFVFEKTNFLASVLPSVLVHNTNQDRQYNNAKPLIVNTQLQRAAELKAQDMAKHGYFSHNGPDGRTPWHWLDQVGYKYAYAGENLAVNFSDSNDVSTAWMNSPSHRANIVKQDYTEIGVGVANGYFEGRPTVFVVQFFGKPLANVATSPRQPDKVAPSPQPEEQNIAQGIPDIGPSNPTTVQVLGDQSNPVRVDPIRLLIQKLMSSPLESLNSLYLLISFAVLMVVVFIFMKNHHENHRQILNRGLGLVAIILIISFVNTRMVSLELTIPNSDISANTVVSPLE